MNTQVKLKYCKTCGLEVEGDRRAHLRDAHGIVTTANTNLYFYFTKNLYVWQIT